MSRALTAHDLWIESDTFEAQHRSSPTPQGSPPLLDVGSRRGGIDRLNDRVDRRVNPGPTRRDQNDEAETSNHQILLVLQVASVVTKTS